MNIKIKKIKIKSNNICYGPAPELEDEVEQVLTIAKTGKVWFYGYKYIGTRSRSIINNIGEKSAYLIFELISKWIDTGLCCYATDVGTWNMVITDENNKLYKFDGSLMEDLVVDGIAISETIRDIVKVDDMFVFDGNKEVYLDDEE